MAQQSNDPPRPEQLEDPDLEASLDEVGRESGDDVAAVLARMDAMIRALGETAA